MIFIISVGAILLSLIAWRRIQKETNRNRFDTYFRSGGQRLRLEYARQKKWLGEKDRLEMPRMGFWSPTDAALAGEAYGWLIGERSLRPSAHDPLEEMRTIARGLADFSESDRDDFLDGFVDKNPKDAPELLRIVRRERSIYNHEPITLMRP